MPYYNTIYNLLHGIGTCTVCPTYALFLNNSASPVIHIDSASTSIYYTRLTYTKHTRTKTTYEKSQVAVQSRCNQVHRHSTKLTPTPQLKSKFNGESRSLQCI